MVVQRRPISVNHALTQQLFYQTRMPVHYRSVNKIKEGQLKGMYNRSHPVKFRARSSLLATDT